MNDWEDALKIERPGAPAAALARARSAAHTELAQKSPSWRRGALAWTGAWAALLAVVTVSAQLGHLSSSAMLARHAPVIATLFATGVLCSIAARAPRRNALRWAALGLALVAGALAVLARYPSTQGSAVPGWACTVNHLLVALLPFGFAIRLMRQSALSPLRSLTFGVGIGTTGAIVGELACAQGFMHVIVFHLGAWLLVAAAALGISRRLSPRSYAP